MSSEEFKTTEEILLDIARYLKENEEDPSKLATSVLTKTLKVSGRQYGETKRLIAEGMIVYDEETGEPFWTVPYSKLQTAIQTTAQTREQAETTVFGVTLKTIADETEAVTKQYYILGKAVWQGIAQWSARKGITPQQLAKMPLHEMVLDGLDKRDRFSNLEREVLDLKETVKLLQGETDPVIRIREACALLVDFVKSLSLAELAGFRIESGGIIDFYQSLLNKYIKGG